jgi:hypothetical protein
VPNAGFLLSIDISSELPLPLQGIIIHLVSTGYS